MIRIKKVRTNNLGPTLNSYTWYNSVNGERLLFYEEKAGASPNAVFNTNIVNSLSDIAESGHIHIAKDMQRNEIVIQADQAVHRVLVYNLSGQFVRSFEPSAAGTIRFRLDFARGVYLLRVESGSQTAYGKVVN